jgi:hypothetical protein
MNETDKSKIEAILKTIAGDDELIEQFAGAVGESAEDFGNWIDAVEI